MGQDLVVDLNQAKRLVRDGLTGRRHRRHDVAVIKCFVARHDVVRDVAEIGGVFAKVGFLGRDVGQVGRGNDGFDTG